MATMPAHEAILIRLGGLQAVVRALISTHPDPALLVRVLQAELLLTETMALHRENLQDHLREKVSADIQAWIKSIQKPARPLPE